MAGIREVGRDFQSVQGPSDPFLNRNEIEGYQPVSRIGEIVINAFVDAYEFNNVNDSLSTKDMVGYGTDGDMAERKPHFHEWASTLPGMICLGRKTKTTVYRQYQAAETAVPVISCAACIPLEDEKQFYFAGITRSKSVRSPDDGIGPNGNDEFFTLSLGGMATLLNNSGRPIHAGDLLEWTLCGESMEKKQYKRAKSAPRRVAVKTASVSSEKIIGRALSFAKNGESFDLLIKQ